MPEKNLLEMLPIELVQQISSFLDYKSIARASKASKTYQGLFNNDSIWKHQLKKEFGIENDLFSQFEKTITEKPNYKQLYANFNRIKQHPNLPKFIKSISREKTQQHLVLLACADIDTCLDEMTREQQYTIAALAVYAGCLNIPRSFLEKHDTKKLLKNLFHHAAISGNIKLMQYLLNSDNKFELIPDNATLNCVAKSGNLQLVQYLVKQFKLNPNQLALDRAAFSGNIQLMKYLLNPDNKFGLETHEYTLNNAAKAGNLQLVQYLLDPDNKFGLIPDNHTLNRAAFSGNLQLVQYLLNPDNPFESTWDIGTLNCAAYSGNLQLMQYLLNPENKFRLRLLLFNNTLTCAAKSGNLQLVQYLLNPDNKFRLIPDINTLWLAARSGSLQLVQYLLNPDNKFRIIPDNYTLNCAAKSGNLQLVQYLLNPDNQFGLKVTQDIVNSSAEKNNFALSEYLMPSHFALQNALEKLQAHDITAAKTLLQESHAACPSHYMMMIKSILDNPQRFNLNDEAIQCLKATILPNPPFSKEGIIKKRSLEDSETPSPKRRP